MLPYFTILFINKELSRLHSKQFQIRKFKNLPGKQLFIMRKDWQSEEVVQLYKMGISRRIFILPKSRSIYIPFINKMFLCLLEG